MTYMKAQARLINCIVAAFLAAFLGGGVPGAGLLAAGSALAQDAPAQDVFAQDVLAADPPGAAPAVQEGSRVDELLDRLQRASPEDAVLIEREIEIEWSKSGSPAMDLLLQRGKDALDAGEPQIALEHLTALTDHDPDFAEGWNALASAHIAIGKLGPAVDDLARCLRLNPRHFGALVSLGQIFEEIDRPDSALEAYRGALALNPQLLDVPEAVKRIEGDIAGRNI
jgi:tetratricopeptide (TPR) repeat protein